MQSFLNTTLQLGPLQLSNRLIQGPLAGFSCAPFRQLFSHFTPPAYCVSEMVSAYDVLSKHATNGRYLHRSKDEKTLCYQISGTEPQVMARAAAKLEALGADLIDINCGCPKTKIRKKGAGSALLEKPQQLVAIVEAVRAAIQCPLTIKIRLQGDENDIPLAKLIANAGADALIVHGRRWTDDYDAPCNLAQIAAIKQAICIPVIANGDIADMVSLKKVLLQTGCDAFMISRAGTGQPWLFQQLLEDSTFQPPLAQRISLFMTHLTGLAQLESEYQAVLQSRALVRYYFKNQLSDAVLQGFYKLGCLRDIEDALGCIACPPVTRC
ncbi:MAG: tRNA-dihydrouridine synthase [Gammaproteobacteria bacterium]|nr:tRNA-dihydrouridine synthase [Gammaproteobacteria bacterium]